MLEQQSIIDTTDLQSTKPKKTRREDLANDIKKIKETPAKNTVLKKNPPAVPSKGVNSSSKSKMKGLVDSKNKK